MIFGQRLETTGAGNWFNNSFNEGLVPFNVYLPGGGTIRIEGRQGDSTTGTILGYAYTSEHLLVPYYKQYRITAVRVGSGNTGAEVKIGRRDSNYPVRILDRNKAMVRASCDAGRNHGLRVAHQIPLDLYTAAGYGSDRGFVASGTCAKDFTNCRSGQIQTAETQPYSIKITTPAGSNGQYQYNYKIADGGSGDVDITGGTGIWPTIYGRVYVDENNAKTIAGSNCKRLFVYLEDVNANAGNFTVAAWDQVTGSAACGPGWLEFVSNQTSGSINPLRINKIGAVLQPDTGLVAEATVDTVKFLIPNPSQRYVVWRDDDIESDNRPTPREFDKQGIRGTFFMKPGLVGTNQSVSLADLRAYQRSGHFIAHQGWSRFEGDTVGGETYNYYSQDPQTFFEQNILQAMIWMQDNGFEKGARVFAPEQGNMSCAQREYALEHGIDHISMCNTPGGEGTHVNHLSQLRTTYSVQYPDNATVDAAMDSLMYRGGLLTMLGHSQTDAVPVVKRVKDRLLPLIKDGTIKAVTFEDIISG